MKIKKVNASDDWLTPIVFYRMLDRRFKFDDFEPCPPCNNIEEFDGLSAEWADRTFCNPPYSQYLKESFIHKALQESHKGKLAVLLIPVSTSTSIFHKLIMPNAKVEFVKGRVKFEGIDKSGNWVNPRTGRMPLPNVPDDAPEISRSGQTDSMIVIFGEE